MLYQRESKTHELKGETLKIYRAILAFYKATIIPIVRWTDIPARFRPNLKNISAPIAVTPADVLARIPMPEVTLEQCVFASTTEAALPAGQKSFKLTLSMSRWVFMSRNIFHVTESAFM
jgi:hypothetical protein